MTAALTLTSCNNIGKQGNNLISSEEDSGRVVNLFSPMEKTDPDAENIARSASEKTVLMAEERLWMIYIC